MGDNKRRIEGYLMSGYLIKATVAADAVREYLYEVLKQNITHIVHREIKRRGIEALQADLEREEYVHVIGGILDLLEQADEQAIGGTIIGYLLEKLAAVEGGLKDAREVMQDNGYIQQQVDLVAQLEAILEVVKSMSEEDRP